jgi:hypothetical protein
VTLCAPRARWRRRRGPARRRGAPRPTPARRAPAPTTPNAWLFSVELENNHSGALAPGRAAGAGTSTSGGASCSNCTRRSREPRGRRRTAADRPPDCARRHACAGTRARPLAGDARQRVPLQLVDRLLRVAVASRRGAPGPGRCAPRAGPRAASARPAAIRRSSGARRSRAGRCPRAASAPAARRGRARGVGEEAVGDDQELDRFERLRDGRRIRQHGHRIARGDPHQAHLRRVLRGQQVLRRAAARAARAGLHDRAERPERLAPLEVERHAAARAGTGCRTSRQRVERAHDGAAALPPLHAPADQDRGRPVGEAVGERAHVASVSPVLAAHCATVRCSHRPGTRAGGRRTLAAFGSRSPFVEQHPRTPIASSKSLPGAGCSTRPRGWPSCGAPGRSARAAAPRAALP